jgi:hypothetical protein
MTASTGIMVQRYRRTLKPRRDPTDRQDEPTYPGDIRLSRAQTTVFAQQTAANFVQQPGLLPACGATCYARTFAGVNHYALTIAMLHESLPSPEPSRYRPSACHGVGNLFYSAQE